MKLSEIDSRVNYEETTEEFVNQIAAMREVQDLWNGRFSGRISAADNAQAAFDTEIAYTLALKERMLREKRAFVETTTHTATIDLTATLLNGVLPKVERKEA